jgi:hypothetical protein
MKKRGIQLAFGMIFSIIIIIAIIAVSFFVISHFLELRDCTEVGIFYQSLQKDVDQIWRSNSARDIFSGSLPSGIEFVCFGDLNQPSLQFQDFIIELRLYNENSNTFLWPIEKACELQAQKIEHIYASFPLKCFEVQSGKIEIPLEFNSGENPLVQIK